MTKVFRIDQITFDPIDIIAEDRDHAAQMFLSALHAGLGSKPTVEFCVSAWTKKRLSRFDTLRRWAEEGREGIMWYTGDGPGWELVPIDLPRN